MNTIHIDRLKKFGVQFNDWFDQKMFILTPVSMILGFLFAPALQGWEHSVPYLFAYLTFVMAIGCVFSQMKEAVKKPLRIVIFMLLTHGVAPLIAYGAGSWLFGADSPYVVGFVLFTIIPLGISTVIWVGISGGSIPLILSMIIIDSILSPFIVPQAVSFMFHQEVEVDTFSMMKGLFLIVVVPTITGLLLNTITKGKLKSKVHFITGPTSKLAMIAVLVINVAVISPFFKVLKEDILIVLPATIALVMICYLLGNLSSFRLKNEQISITLNFASGMRNNSLGIVIAMSYFEPLSSVPVIMCIILQQPLAAIYNQILIIKKHRKQEAFTKNIQNLS